MKLNVFVVFFAPTVLATTKVWNLSGSCNSANVCDVDTAFNNPNNPKVCNGRAGQYVGTAACYCSKESQLEGSGNYSADRGWQAVVSSEVVVSVVSSSKSKPEIRARVEDCEDRPQTIQS
ncbi:hypothetical protein AA0117_g9149 [Alternaria alternata]|uniref:Extracellular membrane protein CFEM domain-containing protein n=1 Tax=Alternaria alternata TaxID=5599 RepID=A0A4Q4N7M8_ALTAL|nr:hypothetical protein AA0117_g9149 [Alternaria alternata]